MFVKDRLVQVLLPDRLQFLRAAGATPESGPCEDRAQQQSNRDSQRGRVWPTSKRGRPVSKRSGRARAGQHRSCGRSFRSFTVPGGAAGVYLTSIRAGTTCAGKRPFWEACVAILVAAAFLNFLSSQVPSSQTPALVVNEYCQGTVARRCDSDCLRQTAVSVPSASKLSHNPSVAWQHTCLTLPSPIFPAAVTTVFARSAGPAARILYAMRIRDSVEMNVALVATT